MIPKDDTQKMVSFAHLALESLRDGGRQWRGTGAFNQVFCFLIVPSFSTAAAYSFSVRREPLDGTRYYCVRTKWDRQYDRERIESSFRTRSDLKPTLEKALIKLSEDYAQSILDQLQDVLVPLFVHQSIQIGGTGYEFSNLHTTLDWGENVPLEWRGLAEILLKYVQQVDNSANVLDGVDR
jgi:hypothetical protein